MEYVIGVDLGTSAVKILLVNQRGNVVQDISKSYPLIQSNKGYIEQDPQVWIDQTTAGLSELLNDFTGNLSDIKGISFSGQMHGLVLLNEHNEVLRHAILWNDTRTTDQCKRINDIIGEDLILEITKNPVLEGFTLPKILWVKEHEPELYKQAKKFVLPKDYLRYKLTGKLSMEYSDAAGTLLLDVRKKEWSTKICELLEIDPNLCPPLISPHQEVGTITSEFSLATGLLEKTRVFAGGADNACGAIGSGVLEAGKTLCSIGTSGVILSYEDNDDKNFQGKMHYFNHAKPNGFYIMGVTLAAGYSLTWFKNVFTKDESFEDLLTDIDSVPVGSNGLLFTPYLMGERTPHADASIRGSFIGMDSNHQRKDFVRSIIEGITFSLNESIEIIRQTGKQINEIVSIGGGAQNDEWLQIQADIFDANIIKLKSEQGPGMGAAMLAAYGCGWFKSLQDCADEFIKVDKKFMPNKTNVVKYQKVFTLYKKIYTKTKDVTEELRKFQP